MVISWITFVIAHPLNKATMYLLFGCPETDVPLSLTNDLYFYPFVSVIHRKEYRRHTDHKLVYIDGINEMLKWYMSVKK